MSSNRKKGKDLLRLKIRILSNFSYFIFYKYDSLNINNYNFTIPVFFPRVYVYF